MDFIKDNFVPVALGFLNGGGGNSVSLQTPNGEALPDDPQEALWKWKELAAEERRKREEFKLEKPAPRLPEGGLAVRVFFRSLMRDAGGKLARITEEEILKNPAHYPEWAFDPTAHRFPRTIYAEPMGDMLWLTESDVKSLVPSEPKVGDRFPVPVALRKRIFRMHLKDATRGWVGYWDHDNLLAEEMSLTVEETSPRLRMKVEGKALIASEREAQRSDHGFDARMGGILEYDPVRKAFVRFDLLAVGDYWGGSGCNRPGRNPLAIAFELRRGNLALDLACPFALYFPGTQAYFNAER